MRSSAGAYVLREAEGDGPELILIGTGSEVSLCLEAADLLADEGVGVRVVSMPSTSRFRQQDQAYRDEVLPPSTPARLSVEAGSTLGWVRWVGDGGEAIGLDHFGASAPAGEIAEHFGLTPHGGGRARQGAAGPMRIACAFDHAGVPLREVVFEALRGDGHESSTSAPTTR